MANERIRKVKLHGKYRALTGHWGYSPGKEVPWLNVSGLWLAQAGFKVGDAVEITVEQNTLTIKNCSAHGNKAD